MPITTNPFAAWKASAKCLDLTSQARFEKVGGCRPTAFLPPVASACGFAETHFRHRVPLVKHGGAGVRRSASRPASASWHRACSRSARPDRPPSACAFHVPVPIEYDSSWQHQKNGSAVTKHNFPTWRIPDWPLAYDTETQRNSVPKISARGISSMNRVAARLPRGRAALTRTGRPRPSFSGSAVRSPSGPHRIPWCR